MSQVRDVRRALRPDRLRSNGCVGTLDSRDSWPDLYRLCACDAIMVLNKASTLDTSFRLAEVLVSDLYATTNNLKLKSSGFFTFDLGLDLRCWTTQHS